MHFCCLQFVDIENFSVTFIIYYKKHTRVPLLKAPELSFLWNLMPVATVHVTCQNIRRFLKITWFPPPIKLTAMVKLQYCLKSGILYPYLFYFWYLGAEQTFQKFLDLCRHTEAFFLNKRLILSKQKPEQAIKDVSYFYTRLLKIVKFDLKDISFNQSKRATIIQERWFWKWGLIKLDKAEQHPH